MDADTRRHESGETVAPRAPATGADSLAWRAVGRTDRASGPVRLELAAADTLPGATTGPGLDALLAGSAALTAAELELGDLTTELDPAALRAAGRINVHLDAAWAGELRLATEAPLLDLVLAAGPQPVATGPEALLGTSLARALELGIDREGVDVSLLRDAAGPLEDLLALLPAWDDGLAPRLRLDSDVLQLVRTTWRLLHVTHQAWFAARNRAVGGDPRQVLPHPVDTWARQLAARAPAVIERVHILRTLEGSEEELGQLVKHHFTWAGSSDREGFATWLEGRIAAPIETVVSLVDPGATELAVRLEPHLPELHTEDDVADAVDAVGSYLEAWLQTDAGLLARLHRELHLASDAWAWRRVALDEDRTDWTVADAVAAARAAAVALGVAELAGSLADPA